MTNRVFSAVLMALLLAVTALSAVHHHPVADSAPGECAACLWHASASMDVPVISYSVVPPVFLLIRSLSDLTASGHDCRGEANNRAPPSLA